MAPNFRHGRGLGMLAQGVLLSEITNDASMAASVDSAETTVHGSTWKSFEAGHRDFQVQVSGHTRTVGTTTYDRAAIEATLGSTQVQVVTVFPEGLTTGLRAKLYAGFWNAHDVTAPITDVVGVAGSLMAGSSQVVGSKDAFGRVALNKLTGASASTHTGPATDGAAASTGGWVADVHVTTQLTSTGGVSTKQCYYRVQHSSSSTAWSDLSTGVRLGGGLQAKRMSGTGAVKRYVRGYFTRPSTSAGVVPSFIISVARR